jgi:hypothetical protein
MELLLKIALAILASHFPLSQEKILSNSFLFPIPLPG